MPIAAQMPWPSEPVATSTNGSRGVGWPSRSESIRRSFSSSARSNAPASAHAAYRIGAAWPFDSTKRSLPGWRGSCGSNRISAKNSAAMTSAADMQLVGWPLPASDVDVIESIRSCVATFFRAGISVARSRAIRVSRNCRFQIADCRLQFQNADCIAIRPKQSAIRIFNLQSEFSNLQFHRTLSYSASARPKGAASTPRSRTDDARAASVRAASAA